MQTGRPTIVVAALVGAVTALGANAAADFADTAGTPFAAEIENIADAGCASGFAGNTFRPRDGVTRQQFAAWMNRCGGRVEYDDSQDQTLATNGEIDVAQASLAAGAIAPGGGFIVAQAALEAADAGVDGSDLVLRLYRGSEVDPLETVDLSVPAEGGVGGSMMKVVPVDGATTTNFRVTAQRADGVAVDVDVSLSLLYVPFAGDGSGGGIERG